MTSPKNRFRARSFVLCVTGVTAAAAVSLEGCSSTDGAPGSVTIPDGGHDARGPIGSVAAPDGGGPYGIVGVPPDGGGLHGNVPMPDDGGGDADAEARDAAHDAAHDGDAADGADA